MSQTPPTQLLWLADAPLFIDEDLVERFFDAVVRPAFLEGATAVQKNDGDKLTANVSGAASIKGSVGTANLISLFFRSDAEASASVAGGAAKEWNSANSTTTQWLPIKTPQRQLEALALTYAKDLSHRLFVRPPEKNSDILEPGFAKDLPRALVLLETLSQSEAEAVGAMPCMLIPTAAEFADGFVKTLFDAIVSDSNELPPPYPESAANTETLRARRREYWEWFRRNYSATKAIVAVEKAASEHGKILWIDYRLPLTKEGETLHLHCCPRGRYDTGTFAYNLIKRGFKHGLRLVGTLKSEPDLNLLAVYEK